MSMQSIAAGLLMMSTALAAATEADPHSFANADQFRTTHLSLDLRADFEQRKLIGFVDLKLQRLVPQAREIVLDTRELKISAVELRNGEPQPLGFAVGAAQPILGAPLSIRLPAELKGDTLTVRVHYESSPQASGLQWLDPSQTSGKRHPFMYSQSQAIHARSWIPLQDTPRVRATYEAHIRTPQSLVAVMSAENDPDATRDGDYRFRMPQAIPSYLIALGIGDLEFRSLGKQTGVYAEPSVVAAAASEFADVQAMLEACEKLFGPYRWGRYDLLILPPSFMWGGMENPRLTFLTPTVIAGDRSLVSLIAHELAHSWSGNLVTNANWNGLWLNEGFTVYLERRIIEALYGKDRYAMEDVLGLQSLQRDIEDLTEEGEADLTRLDVDLKGRDPDDAFSEVPYEKGRLFLGFLEARVGRAELDRFLRGYFDHFAFQSIDTETFVNYLSKDAPGRPNDRLTPEELRIWLEEPGIPRLAVLPHSAAFQQVDAQRDAWLRSERAAGDLQTAQWTTHEWLHFLDNLPRDLSSARLAELDAAFDLTASSNAMVAHSWLLDAIRANYAPAWTRLEQYLTTIGRRKLVKDLYEELMKTPEGKVMAQRIYAQARPLYQIPLVEQLDVIVGKPAD